MTELTGEDLGAVVREQGRTGLRFERRYAHPIETVWAAITESEQLRAWMPCDIVGERREGAALTLPFWPAQVEKYAISDPVLTGRIEVWEPPRVFQWTWGADVLRFELEPDGPGTVLTLTTWIDRPDRATVVDNAGGYHVCLYALRRWLDTGVAEPVTEHDHLVAALAPAYEARI